MKPPAPPEPVTPDDAATFSRLMAQFGRKGGHARAAALTPRKRSAISRKAGRTRWDRVRAAQAAQTDKEPVS